MPRGPRYPDATKAEAIALAQEVGAAEAARRMNLHPPTLRSWCSRAGVATVATERTQAAVAQHKLTMEERRLRLADRLLELAAATVEEADKVIGESDLRDLVGAWDYAIKNSQLLSGQATARTETGDTRTQADAVVDELSKRRATRAA